MKKLVVLLFMILGVVSYSQTKEIDSLNVEIQRLETEIKQHKKKYYETGNISEKEKLSNHIIDDTFVMRDLIQHRRILIDDYKRKNKK